LFDRRSEAENCIFHKDCLLGTLTGGKFTERVWGEGVPRRYASAKGLPLEEAREHVFREYAVLGEGRTEWYDIKYWFRFFGLGEDWQDLLDSYKHEICVFSDVHRVLDLLSREYPLIVTSNASREFTDIELESTGLKSYFTSVFSSTSDFGEVKKTPQVYLKVCQLVNVEPEEVAHVGDHRTFDCQVPQQVGIKAFYLDRAGKERGDCVLHNLSQFVERIRLCY
jgi:HAD superfamily hydrolase (TIGR01493 family)